MNCIVTAGPTYESLDDVRRMTNFSSGRLGTELANYLVSQGHQVTLLAGTYVTYRGECKAQKIRTFTTTANLQAQFKELAAQNVDAIFHAAAVSDFGFGKVWVRSPQGELTEVKSTKISTRQGTLLAELVPTPKVIAGLREWYPNALLVGWKYETEGGREDVVRAAEAQLVECRTDVCVANGPAYGRGFGVVTSKGQNVHLADKEGLYEALGKLRSP